MPALLDYIFHNLEERNLEKSKIKAYLRYLDELIRHGLPLNKEVTCQRIRLKLIRRLNELNQEQINFYRKDKGDNKEDIGPSEAFRQSD
jgi:hypothetical protein